MANATDYTVRLVDKVSGPAKKATAGITKITAATTKLNKNGRLVDAVTGKFIKMGDAASGMGAAAGRAKGGIGALLTSLAAIGFVANLAQRGIDLVQRGIVALGGAFVKAIASAESLQFSLTRFLGSGSKAAAALKRVSTIANTLGLDFQTAAGNFKNFISAGFTEIESENLLRFKADLLALGDGSEIAGQRIEEAFIQVEKAMATGRIEADQFNSILANLPVTKMDVLAKLSEKTGVAVEKLAKMDVTKLPVKELIASFQEASLAATGLGKLGEAATAKIFSTVSGAAGFIKTRFVNVLDDLAARVGPAIGAKLLPVIERLITFMQSPAFDKFIANIADKLVAGLDSAIDAVTEFISMFDTDDPSLIKDLVVTFWEVHSAITAVTDVFGMVKAAIAATFPPTSIVVQVLRLLASVWLVVAKAIIGVVEIITGVLGAALAFVIEKIAWLIEEITGIDIDTSDIGTGIISGIVSGILSGASAVVEAISTTVTDAIAAAKSLLGESSPSKVFKAIGKNTAIGFAQGISSEAPMVAAASSGMVRPTGGSGGGGPTTVHQSNNFDTTVNEAESAATTAKEVQRLNMLAMAANMERLALELGSQ
jgi:tape measure domain-containing protein